MGDAIGCSLGQGAVQCYGFGRGVGQRSGPCAFDPCGAKVHGLVFKFQPDLAHEGRNRRFAVGARDRDHVLGVRPEPKRGCIGQRLTRIIREDQRGVRGIEHVFGNGRTVFVGQNGSRPLAQGVLNKLSAVDLSARDGDEQIAIAHFAAVDGDACNGKVAARVSTARLGR